MMISRSKGTSVVAQGAADPRVRAPVSLRRLAPGAGRPSRSKVGQVWCHVARRLQFLRVTEGA